MTAMEDRWLSVDETGKYFGVSSDTVYRWIDKHAMPAHHMGRLWKLKKDQVDEWAKAGMRPSLLTPTRSARRNDRL